MIKNEVSYIPLYNAECKNLSLEAYGLFCFIFNKNKHGLTVEESDLYGFGPDPDETVDRALKELVCKGYLTIC